MIYCVEDDDSIREIEIYALRSTGFAAEGFVDGKSLFAALDKQLPQLLILDIMLPGDDGIAILKKLRATPASRALPVILATAKGTEFDKVQGLDLGADDYLVKPFGMLEMVSRVRAVLRRTAPEVKDAAVMAGPVILNTDEHTVMVNNQRVILTLKEFELLRVMMEHQGIVFSRERLLNDVWGVDYYGETRTVDMHIKTLRQKLGDGAGIIETVRGIGYRIEVQRA